jgi:hypothetical protein
VEIYRTGGCRLREIERTAIARWTSIEPLAIWTTSTRKPKWPNLLAGVPLTWQAH